MAFATTSATPKDASMTLETVKIDVPSSVNGHGLEMENVMLDA